MQKHILFILLFLPGLLLACHSDTLTISSKVFGQDRQVIVRTPGDVDDPNYKLVAEPGSPSEELQKVNDAAKVGDYFYPPEIGEIFGLASRYINSGYNEQAIAVYESGLNYYPRLYDLHVSLYDLYLEKDENMAKKYLLEAYRLLDKMERGEPEAEELLMEIEEEIKKNGW